MIIQSKRVWVVNTWLAAQIEVEEGKNISATRIMESIQEPLALVQGEYPNNVVTPTQISQIYLDLTKILKLPQLKTNMTLTQFRSCTKLDLTINLTYQDILKSPKSL